MLPARALETGRALVLSAQGQPFHAIVPIQLGPDEQIDSECLSTGTAQDFPQADYPLLNGASLSLNAQHDAVHVVTRQPIRRANISFALRVQCTDGFVTVRAMNLFVPPAASLPQPPGGTLITVRPGDTLFGLSRAIHPADENAVAALVRAIVLANPQRFPDGARPLRTGERLQIPDLRRVYSADGASAGQKPVPAMARVSGSADQTPSPARAPNGVTQGGPAKPDARVIAGSEPDSAASGTSQSNADRQPVVSSSPVRSSEVEDTMRWLNPLSQRAENVARLQTQLAERLVHLEASIVALRSATVELAALLATQSGPRAVRKETQPAALPPVLAAPQARLPGTQEDAAFGWLWFGFGVAATVFVAAVFFLGRLFQQRSALRRQTRRIDALLEQARNDATPLLDPLERSSPPPSASATAPPRASPARPLQAPAVAQTSRNTVDAPMPATVLTFGPGGNEPPPRLRMEMDDAMDTARSMFSDVDRFIMLGRANSAISLLQHRIARHRADRAAWIKLLAVYRSEQLDEDFERTFAAFQQQFKDDPE